MNGCIFAEHTLVADKEKLRKQRRLYDGEVLVVVLYAEKFGV